MSNLLIALILFGLGAYAGMVTRDGYRDGRMPALISSRVNPFVFDRVQVPAWFWGATAVNIAIATLLVASSAVVALAAMMR